MLSRSTRKRLATRALVALLLGVLAGWILIGIATRVGPSDAGETSDPRAGVEKPPEVVPPRAPLDAEHAVERSAASPETTSPAASSRVDEAAAMANDVRVRVAVVDVDEAPIARATCLVVPVDGPGGSGGSGAPATMDRWKRALSNELGIVETGGLTLGRNLVMVAVPNQAARRFDVELELGLNDLGRVEFAKPEATADLVVRLAGPGLVATTTGVVHVWSADGGDVDRWGPIARPSWIRADARVDPSCTFREVPHGRYTVSFARSDRFAAPMFRTVDVPATEVVLELDDAGVLPVRVRATDASGELVKATLVLFADRHARPHVVQVTGGDAIVASEPSTERTVWRWVLLAKDREPVQGTSADFRRQRATLVEGDELFLEARMEPGIGALVVARNADPLVDVPRSEDETRIASGSLPALEGVDVSVAGKTLATTDADGIAIVPLARNDAILEIGGARSALIGAFNWKDGAIEDVEAPVLALCASRR